MRKLALSILCLMLTALPAVAQIAIPAQFPGKERKPTLFTEQVVFSQGVRGQTYGAYGTAYRMQGTLSSLTSGAATKTLTIPANSLKNAGLGHGYRVRLFGRCAANANNKTVQVKFGGTTIAILNAVASNAKDFWADIMIYRTGASTQRISVAGYANNAFLDNLSVNATETETAAIALSVNLPTSTGAADVVVDDFTVFAD